MRLRDEFGVIYEDAVFRPLFATRGRPAEAPWRLALVSVMQFAEQLSDRQAAEAVRARIDWKYLLGLELPDPGVDASVLSEFRARLVAGGLEQRLLDALLTLCRARGWLQAGGRQRTDPPTSWPRSERYSGWSVPARRCAARSTPWHRSPPLGWFGMPNLSGSSGTTGTTMMPGSPPGRWIGSCRPRKFGTDGAALLEANHTVDSPAWLREIPAVETLRRVWVQNYVATDTGLRWRTRADGLPPAARYISSPHDLEAHFAHGRSIALIGCKLHVTETCEPETPHLVTHVETTTAPVADGTMTPSIHSALQANELLPWDHLVDTGYVDTGLRVSSQRVTVQTCAESSSWRQEPQGSEPRAQSRRRACSSVADASQTASTR